MEILTVSDSLLWLAAVNQAIINTLDLLAVFAIAGLFLEKRDSTSRGKRIVFIIVCLVADIALLRLLPEGFGSLTFLLRTFSSSLARSLYIILLFKCSFLSFKRLSAMIMTFSLIGITILIEAIIAMVVVALGLDTSQWIILNIASYIARFIMFLLYALIRKIYERASNAIIKRSVHFLFIVYLIVVFTTALWLENDDQTHFWIALLILFAVVSILVIILISESAAKKQEQEQAKLLSLQNELITERLESDKRLMDAVHQTRHDLHKHLDYVHSLLDEARSDEARQYIQEIAKPVNAEIAPVRSGCSAIDTVLQIEQRKASAQGITMEVVAHGLPEDCIAPADCNCILGNLLDNAIEAQAKVAEDKRYIQVSVRLKHDFLMINIKNAVAENPLLNNEKLHSTKKEQQHLHGIGLKSVEAAVKRYAGELSYGFENRMFTVSVLLCSKIT